MSATVLSCLQLEFGQCDGRCAFSHIVTILQASVRRCFGGVAGVFFPASAASTPATIVAAGCVGVHGASTDLKEPWYLLDARAIWFIVKNHPL